jgi:hypothetical protein
VIRQVNAGIARTRQRLLAETRGRYVAIADPDDIHLPDRLAMQARFLESHPCHALVGGQSIEIEEDGRELSRAKRYPADDRTIRTGCGLTFTWCHAALMLSAQAMRAVGGYRAEFGNLFEDWDLIARLFLRYRAANLHDYVVKYRLRRGSALGVGNNDQALAVTLRAYRGDLRGQRPYEEAASTAAIPGVRMAPHVELASREAIYQRRCARAALRGRQLRKARGALMAAIRVDR